MPIMTLCNKTDYIAQFVVTQGKQVIARIPGIEPGGSVKLPTMNAYDVSASMLWDNKNYTSAIHRAVPGKKFIAQALQTPNGKIYDFNIIESNGDISGALIFEKTTSAPVIYTILKEGKLLHKIVVSESFEREVLHVGRTFYIYSVVNGVTTPTISTSDPEALVSVVNDASTVECSSFHLKLNECHRE